ncbi:MAG: hypothetical protein FJ242_09880 [Nitrospira sp.]|nr:hypothetical protein [Nitrospira sp.]
MKRTLCWILILGLIISLGMLGCAKKESEIKIGAIIPLTGSFATYGEPVRDGMLLAVEEINKDGGIEGKRIKLIIEDDAGDPKTAVNAFNKLANTDKTPIVLGPLSSGSSMATAPIAEKTKVVQLSTLAGIPDLSKAGDYVFRIYPSTEIGARFAAEQAFNRFKPKRVAIMYMNNPFGEAAKKIYVETAKEFNIKVADTESFSDGEKDFRTQLSKIKQSAPDVLFCSAYWGEGSGILVQMQEFGLNVPVVGEDGWRGPIADIVGKKGLNKLYFVDIAFGPEFKDNDVIQMFLKRFEEKYHKKASTYAATGYDAVYIAKKTIEAGGYSGEGIKNALYKVDYMGALGHIKFDKNGDNIGVKFALFQLNENNEGVLVK